VAIDIGHMEEEKESIADWLNGKRSMAFAHMIKQSGRHEPIIKGFQKHKRGYYES
jgi:hypothetical protein